MAAFVPSISNFGRTHTVSTFQSKVCCDSSVSRLSTSERAFGARHATFFRARHATSFVPCNRLWKYSPRLLQFSNCPESLRIVQLPSIIAEAAAATPESTGGVKRSLKLLAGIFTASVIAGATFVLGGDTIVKPFFAEISRQVAVYLPKILISIAIFLVTRIGQRMADTLVKKICTPTNVGLKRLEPLINSVADVGILFLGIVSIMGTLGIDVSALVTGLGLTGFAFGFATKDLISNLLAGVLIIAVQPFQIGNTVQVDGERGQVTAVDLRYTTLTRVEDGKPVTVLIPNSTLMTSKITILQA
eukprot:CAMPEP_0184654766 /NCGR_PEP_ID=MMETSP0308-20130426/12412_1 /TAXON_ID=38269 /ORGANISM="Gloeochaete witrockiana, Strain SAG 46.84" /LENGTH=302 /DNA_ID=CAMNT_0027090895 /DNA_START=57 /DNA_END=965 /DNA_ORIENTATION=+